MLGIQHQRRQILHQRDMTDVHMPTLAKKLAGPVLPDRGWTPVQPNVQKTPRGPIANSLAFENADWSGQVCSQHKQQAKADLVGSGESS